MRQGAAALGAAVTLALALTGSAAASPRQDSLFMDDPALVHGTPERVEQTLAQLRGLGVDRVRVSLLWHLVAPSPESKERPAFDARDPLAYPPGAWARYDRVLRAAARHGLRVMLTLTGPAPLWATGSPRRTTIEETYTPDPRLFRDFAEAAGRRYPGVDSWSVWNEPNHPGWLTPQWAAPPGGGRWLPAAPALYRELADAAWQGLGASGHGADEVLIGELAPRGWDRRGVIQAIRPGEFIRELYCVEEGGRPYRGEAARLRGCPASGRGLARLHPVLFEAAGFAHHPYGFALPPLVDEPHPDDLPLAGIARLEQQLDDAMAVHRVRRRMPIYITEYGYQTRPDPKGVSQATQAAWLAQAEFEAFTYPRVATVAQFLLRDDGPLPGFAAGNPRRWGSFQTGLLTAGGAPKRALASYARPLFVYPRRLAHAGAVRVFARLRGARTPVVARIEQRPDRSSSFRVVRRVRTNDRGFVDVRIRMRQSASLRVVFGHLHTRAVRVAIGR